MNIDRLNELIVINKDDRVDAEAKNFRARLFGIFYEELLETCFKNGYKGYNLVEKNDAKIGGKGNGRRYDFCLKKRREIFYR